MWLSKTLLPRCVGVGSSERHLRGFEGRAGVHCWLAARWGSRLRPLAWDRGPVEPWGLVCRAWQTVKGLEGPILESSSVRATASVDRDPGLLTPTLVALCPSSILGFPFHLTRTQVQAPVTHPGP